MKHSVPNNDFLWPSGDQEADAGEERQLQERHKDHHHQEVQNICKLPQITSSLANFLFRDTSFNQLSMEYYIVSVEFIILYVK